MSAPTLSQREPRLQPQLSTNREQVVVREQRSEGKEKFLLRKGNRSATAGAAAAGEGYFRCTLLADFNRSFAPRITGRKIPEIEREPSWTFPFFRKKRGTFLPFPAVFLHSASFMSDY